MPAFKDLTGRRFGRLVVVASAGRNQHGRPLWDCLCDCGGEKLTCSNKLSRGHTTSCGCYQQQRVKEVCTTHGLVGTPEYGTLMNIISRCEDPTHPAFPHYGGRGIVVCQSWRYNPAAFVGDVGPRPSSSHSIHRVDNDAGYFPCNCRWADDVEQNSNKRDTRWIEFDGRKMTCRQWEDALGFSHGVILARLDRGWPIDKALMTPTKAKRPPKEYAHAGQTLTLRGWSEATGLSASVLHRRIEVLGWAPDRAITSPLVRESSANAGRPKLQPRPKVETKRRTGVTP